MITVLTALAGGVGAATRLLVDGTVRTRIPAAGPLGTLIVNVTGSLALGIVLGVVEFHGVPNLVAAVAGSGFLGAYTTFSTASFETVRLMQERSRRTAARYAASTLVAALAAAALGQALAAAG